MRISEQTANILTSLAKKHFGDDAPVRLFGSRTNDNVRGGDIDIHIIAPKSSFRDELSFLAEVEGQLDEPSGSESGSESPSGCNFTHRSSGHQ
ncbi:hypothetical protein [Polynucleobacter kasalickyi]|uniref:Polymerase nucleotidyl transferase domain-containing protein n=1 Tax=Polynucleobacter kasalickyi TaxID=1938817 RepID=A0A1W1Y1U4_9BURK|nr:hypothetical protein [Polynucleobacter kasalickyi]SMC30105.1 hypothetical protein SAMN06296008_10137 [Polynucleobacter kasalickyi]